MRPCSSCHSDRIPCDCRDQQALKEIQEKGPTQMTKHTYQPGDRVVLKNIAGLKATLDQLKNGLWQVSQSTLGSMSDHLWKSGEDFIHDTDIQPGDWVRHESVNGDMEVRDEWTFQVKEIWDNSCSSTQETRKWRIGWGGAWLCNIVKIAPPQQEEPVRQPERVTIRHAEHGDREDVEVFAFKDGLPEAVTWKKNQFGGTMYYFSDQGWAEVPQKLDVTGEVEVTKDTSGCTSFRLDNKDAGMSREVTFTKAQAVVLPEGMTWRDFWFQFWADTDTDEPPESPERVCERMATTVIQVWKEGE